MYDNPDPDSGYRPWATPVERIHGEVSAFLGIPYAIPPVLEGRFKVSKTSYMKYIVKMLRNDEI